MANDAEPPSTRRGKVGWTGQIIWGRNFDDKRLTVVAQPFLKARTGTVRWAGLAVEAPARADSLAEILANHSHADLGDFDTLIECLAACEKYIELWSVTEVRQAACECAEIVPPGSSNDADFRREP
jgi:hypothetical protein